MEYRVLSVKTGHSVGSFDTLDKAKDLGKRMIDAANSGIEDSVKAPVFVVEVPDGHSTGGRLVAGFDPEYGWADIDANEIESEWWTKLSERARRWLVDHPRDDLPAWMVEEAGKSGAGVHSAYWVENGPTGLFSLRHDAQEWAIRRRLVEGFGRL